MRTLLITATIFLLSASAAWAGPLPADRAATDDAVVERIEGGEGPSPAGAFTTPLQLDFRAPRLPLDASVQSIDLRMAQPGPASLALRVDMTPWLTAYVTADLDAALPRLDAVDGDTYFAPGLELHLMPWLTFFLEDFQPASGVVGGGPDDPTDPWIPERSWDGHQVSVGARLAVSEQVDVEAAAVVYTLSPSQRRSTAGATVAVTIRY